ncbi:MAG TPA: NUDIX hydrolase [Acidimicrobiia bacterium]|nr:NUDIX hydrolase [Acidimicrobiia bacterium]
MSPKDKGADAPVRAAGGVVRRRVGRLGRRHDEVLVIHRPRYDDWSFPKGKLDDGEGFEEAALREVEEETGLACRLLADLGETHYPDRKGRPKVVRYWLMERADPAAETDGFVPNQEVDEVRWMKPAEAATLLTYPHDRQLLDRLPRGRRPP